MQDLQEPVHQHVAWWRKRPRAGETDLSCGVTLDCRFPDPHGRLATAYADFKRFLQVGRVKTSDAYRMVTELEPTRLPESHRVIVNDHTCRILAGDTEGIRRGLVWIEDQMLRAGGPFLRRGEIARKPVIRTRISRCFFGPINRPPKNRDELADDVDYYPDEYLNRLAHDGVNVLWITIHFFQIVPSKIIPEYGQNAGPRLEKLRRTVRKCERYGIQIYPFCIEPAAFTWPYPEIAAAAAAHPELKGHLNAFCTSTEQGQAYLEEATRTLFSEVPGLGGLIVIPVGERYTHCYSSSIFQGKSRPTPNTCSRCSVRKPWEVLSDTLAGLARGMHFVNPEAELIAWPYSQSVCWGAKATVEAAGHIPKGVILQHNFETGGRNKQLGKWRPAWDYWLSYVGPSTLFARCARRAIQGGARVSAKLQIGCSHEVATTQVVPVPGILYKKYREMRRLGVSAAMHSWYFGAYPSLMTKAAGELSFNPWPKRDRDFLLSLARRDWGSHAAQVVKAWKWFEKGYSHYPTAHIFGYYGPMHNGPVWPLYLIPRRLPLAPTWLNGYPPSGDYIAECVVNGFTLKEMVILCRRMTEQWARGVKILKNLRKGFRSTPERLKEIGLATALGLQFQSGYNILRFYALREELAEGKGVKRQKILKVMAKIVREEIRGDRELLPLVAADSRLGFHSEAEGYKYFPDLLRWRMQQLRNLLKTEFSEIKSRIATHAPLFPEYTGERPSGAIYGCRFLQKPPSMDGKPFGGVWDELPQAKCHHGLHRVFNRKRWKKCNEEHDHNPLPENEKEKMLTFWKAYHDRRSLILGVCCKADPSSGKPSFQGHGLQVMVEPRRTEPRRQFLIDPDGTAQCVRDDGYISRTNDGCIPHKKGPWRVSSQVEEDAWSIILRIPFAWLGRRGLEARHPLRLNVVRTMPGPGKTGLALNSWAEMKPTKERLVWEYLNPATDFGWVSFE